ncbi:MAG: ATP-dependent zinc protease [Synechococcaceae cyanobacterium SM2_3_1]|nr:ATP-dependent zinc protease [Synechococcaceae cyanobacterium SM2_3_1]
MGLGQVDRIAERGTQARIIGWREWVGLPLLNVDRIKAKVDSGARTSALHAYDIEIVPRDGCSMVRFKIHPLQRDTHFSVQAEAPLLTQRSVRSSNGRAEMRPVIRTMVKLGAQWPMELTLTNRDMMGFRLLLGREAIRGRFLIDTNRSYLQSSRHL